MNDADIVHLCRNSVHAVCGGTCQDFVFAWCTEAAEEVVYRFIGSNAYKEVCGCEVLGRVGMGISKGAE